MSIAKRNTGYDVIRIIAIFMVVAIHSHVAPLSVNQGTPMWYFVMLMQTLCVIAVPLFFMVSGALLLLAEKTITVETLYKSRIPKQAIPFIVWSIVYVLVRVVMGKIPFSAEAFTSLLYEPAYYQFWFMYTLLAIYLLLPVLHTLVKNCDKKKIEYILLLWAVFSIFIPLASRYIHGFKISDHVGLVLCEGYIGYFILGYYLSKYKRDVKPCKASLLWVAGVVVTAICAVAEYAYSRETAYSGFFYQAYVVPGAAVASVGAFLFFQNKKYKLKEKSVKIITTLSSLSIGVYYIHMLVLTVIEYAGFKGENNIIILGVKIIATYLVSLLGAYIISLIPGVRKILLGAK